MKPARYAIIIHGHELSENEITEAFKGNEGAQWWKALIQLIEKFRAEYPGSASAYAGSNNALGMARDVGAHEALTGLLIELEKRQSG